MAFKISLWLSGSDERSRTIFAASPQVIPFFLVLSIAHVSYNTPLLQEIQIASKLFVKVNEIFYSFKTFHFHHIFCYYDISSQFHSENPSDKNEDCALVTDVSTCKKPFQIVSELEYF